MSRKMRLLAMLKSRQADLAHAQCERKMLALSDRCTAAVPVHEGARYYSRPQVGRLFSSDPKPYNQIRTSGRTLALTCNK